MPVWDFNKIDADLPKVITSQTANQPVIGPLSLPFRPSQKFNKSIGVACPKHECCLNLKCLSHTAVGPGMPFRCINGILTPSNAHTLATCSGVQVFLCLGIGTNGRQLHISGCVERPDRLQHARFKLNVTSTYGQAHVLCPMSPPSSPSRPAVTLSLIVPHTSSFVCRTQN